MWIVLPLMLLLMPSQSHAYLDPGAGSMLLQIILGGLAGLAILSRLFWQRIKACFFNKVKNPSEPKQ
ncbi:MAG: hypothetical protein BA871_16910 [Desulfuromonadales bacterium C00003096]|nr:MAG: hypothetical protein BA871_16910 [Desulfuromonadales bacterium C00003096]